MHRYLLYEDVESEPWENVFDHCTWGSDIHCLCLYEDGGRLQDLVGTDGEDRVGDPRLLPVRTKTITSSFHSSNGIGGLYRQGRQSVRFSEFLCFGKQDINTVYTLNFPFMVTFFLHL